MAPSTFRDDIVVTDAERDAWIAVWRPLAEAVRRARKLQRKKLQREGLLPMPKKVELPGRGPRPQ